MTEQVYLGDGLYARYDGHQFELVANNGIRDTAVVYLEPEVLSNFEDFVARIRGKK